MMANAYQVNDFINKIQATAENELLKMKKEYNSINMEQLSYLIGCKINNNGTDEEINKNKNLIYYSKKLLEQKKSLIKIVTQRSCNQTVKMLEEFEKQQHRVLTFETIDMSFYRDFVKLLEKQNYSLNSIGKHIKNLKVFLNDALTNGITTNAKFKSRNFKVLTETTTEIYLTVSEIETLAKKDFSGRPSIELARDIFLIGCYTGQRVSDYNGLTNDNIEIINGHKFIKVRQKKTDTTVHIPLTPLIIEVMVRHNNDFPRKLSEPILRKNIKTACSNVGFKDTVTTIYTKGGTQIKEKIPKYKLVKTHTARRSFCTNHYIANKPIQNIMLFSGHKTEREFLKYIRIEKNKRH